MISRFAINNRDEFYGASYYFISDLLLNLNGYFNRLSFNDYYEIQTINDGQFEEMEAPLHSIKIDDWALLYCFNFN